MWYAFICEDAPGTLEQRMLTRPAHLERLNALDDEGRLLLAGAFPAIDKEDPGQAGFTGSLIVARFESLAAAQAWADEEPFVATGVYAKVTVQPFRKALPA